MVRIIDINNKIPMVIKMDGMACDSDEPPSQYEKSIWMVVSGKGRVMPKKITKDIRLSEAGKWLVFLYESKIDSIWAKIKELYKSGDLWGSAKCSTQKSKSANMEGNYVVVLYCTCEEDRLHNRQILREKVGILWKIPYKLEVDTGKRYYDKGDRNISKYYE